jgi:hypothetical protein
LAVAVAVAVAVAKLSNIWPVLRIATCWPERPMRTRLGLDQAV